MSGWGWSQPCGSGGAWYQGSAITTTTSATTFPYYIQPVPLPGVLESPSHPLSDREWLDAQIAEVCDLASAA